MVGRRRVPFTDQQLITLIALHKKGMNDVEIAGELGVPKYVVKYRRRKLGLESNYKLLFTDQELISLHERGLNDREKAERLGASEEVVFYHRKRLGLKPVQRKR